MGGVPVLLMMAALGITYGWQPDHDGGVEYIIQLHPDEVQELRSLGEVTSVIDPAVQGHVSRIVLRVGDSELPRQMPKHLANKSSASSTQADKSMETNDYTPIAIPQLGDSPAEVPLLALNAAVNSRPGAAMKPQTGGTASSGLSLPPSLAVDSASSFQTSANGATTPSTDPNPGYRIPPPATRTPTNQPVAAPPFTGPLPNTASTTNPMATSRAGGPTTDPMNRDASWTQFPAPTTASPTATSSAATPGAMSAPAPTAATTSSNVPSSLLPTNPFANRTNATASPSTAFGASPVSSTDTFGRTPAGLTAPTSNQASPFGTPPPTSSTAQQGSFVNVPSTESIFNKGQTPAPSSTSPYATQANQFNPQSAQPSTSSASNNFGVPPGTNRFGQSTANTSSQLPGRFGVNPSTAPTSTPARTGGVSGGYPTSTTGTTRPDPSLTPAQIAAGAWSVDAYGQPVDRRGRPVATTGNLPGTQPNAVAGGNSFQTPSAGSNSSFSRLGNPTSSSPVMQTSGQSPFGYGSTPGGAATTGPPRLGQSREPTSPSSERPFGTSQRPSRPQAGLASNSPPNVTLSSNSGIEPVTQPKRVAAQPLFNGLLLISVVANIYLIFWLKNLRVQYHDLVAAKRMASSGNTATS